MDKLAKIKKRVFEIIQIGNQADIPSLIFDVFIVCVILLNIAVTFCQTFTQLARFGVLMQVVELVTISIFTVEYILRLWTAQYLYPDMGLSLIHI